MSPICQGWQEIQCQPLLGWDSAWQHSAVLLGQCSLENTWLGLWSSVHYGAAEIFIVCVSHEQPLSSWPPCPQCPAWLLEPSTWLPVPQNVGSGPRQPCSGPTLLSPAWLWIPVTLQIGEPFFRALRIQPLSSVRATPSSPDLGDFLPWAKPAPYFGQPWLGARVGSSMATKPWGCRMDCGPWWASEHAPIWRRKLLLGSRLIFITWQ